MAPLNHAGLRSLQLPQLRKRTNWPSKLQLVRFLSREQNYV